MSRSTKNILFVNFSGLGNGVLIIPMFMRLKAIHPECRYYHVENPMFALQDLADWLNLGGFLGTVPSPWRRFAEEDHEQIENFIRENNISLIVNLRNEGPVRDHGYTLFKNRAYAKGLDFVELDHRSASSRTKHKRILEDQLDALARYGLDLRPLPTNWLKDFLQDRGELPKKTNEVGLFTGANQKIKRWQVERWISLGRWTIEELNKDIVVFAGTSVPEQEEARQVYEALKGIAKGSRCQLVIDISLECLIRSLSAVDLLVSNDTVAIHLAAALGVQTIGLYFSTDKSIWGGASDCFQGLQSLTGLRCASFKRDAGNCQLYYQDCPAPCKDDIAPELVSQTVKNVLQSVDSSRRRDLSPVTQPLFL